MHHSATTLELLTFEVYNADCLTTEQDSAGKSLSLTFMWMPPDTSHVLQTLAVQEHPPCSHMTTGGSNFYYLPFPCCYLGMAAVLLFILARCSEALSAYRRQAFVDNFLVSFYIFSSSSQH